jgi:hypothetical protein
LACTRTSSNYFELILPLCLDVWRHSYLTCFHPFWYKCFSNSKITWVSFM